MPFPLPTPRSSLLPAPQLGVNRGGAAAMNHQGRRHAEQRQRIFKAAAVYEKTRPPMHPEDRGEYTRRR